MEDPLKNALKPTTELSLEVSIWKTFLCLKIYKNSGTHALWWIYILKWGSSAGIIYLFFIQTYFFLKKNLNVQETTFKVNFVERLLGEYLKEVQFPLSCSLQQWFVYSRMWKWEWGATQAIRYADDMAILMMMKFSKVWNLE